MSLITLFFFPCCLLTAEENSSQEPPLFKKTSSYSLDQQASRVTPPKPSRFQLGGTYSYCWAEPKDDVHTQGNLGGIQTIYEYTLPNSIYTGVAATWRQGPTKSGSTKLTIIDIDAQERLGFSLFRSANKTQFSLFSGVGYRYFGEKRTVAPNCKVSFNFENFYVPVGFLLSGEVNSTLTLGINFQWKPQVFTVVEIKPMNGAYWNLNRKLNNFLVETPFTISLQRLHRYDLSLLIVPFFEMWTSGHANASSSSGFSLNFPEILYLFAGANVNLGVSF